MKFEELMAAANDMIASLNRGIQSPEQGEEYEREMADLQKHLQAAWATGLREQAEAKEAELLDAWEQASR